jgi:hypothetical protein
VRKPKQVTIRHGRSETGEHIVLVPLASRKPFARMWAHDFQRLMERGLSPSWSLSNKNFVMVWLPAAKRQASVARILLDAGAGQIVWYLDGDCTNLCRDNLALLPSRKATNRDSRYARPIDGRTHGETLEHDFSEFDFSALAPQEVSIAHQSSHKP